MKGHLLMLFLVGAVMLPQAPLRGQQPLGEAPAQPVQQNKPAPDPDPASPAKEPSQIPMLQPNLPGRSGPRRPIVPGTTEMKIFSLVNSNAVDATNLLEQVFSDQSATFVADSRTNTVVVRGPAELLLEIEALLLRLDAEGSRPQTQTSRTPPAADDSDALLDRVSLTPTVVIQPTGKLYFGGEGGTLFTPIELDEITAEKLGNPYHIAIETASGTPAKRVVEVMDVLKNAGVKNITLKQPRPGQQQAEMPKFTAFKLEHNSAETVAQLLTQLYSRDDVTIVADRVTNFLIVRGPDSKMKEMQDLLKVLDQPPERDSQNSPFASAGKGGMAGGLGISRSGGAMPGMGGGGMPGMPGRSDPVKGLENAYRRAEQQAQQSAAALVRSGPEAAKRDDARTAPLRRHVEAAFETRQNLQRAEVAALRERLERIEQSIAARAKLKDKIVESRVAELLDPNLQWEPLPPVGPARATAASEPQSAAAPSALAPVDPELPVVPAPVGTTTATAPAPTYPATSRPTLQWAPSTASDNPLILRSAEEFARELSAAEEQAKHSSRLAERGFASPGTRDGDERRLRALQAEYAAQLRLLELELQNAELALETGQTEFSRARALHETGNVNASEVGRLRLAEGRARVRLEQLKTLYELYRNAVKTPDLTKEPPPQKLPAADPYKAGQPPSALEPAAKPAAGAAEKRSQSPSAAANPLASPSLLQALSIKKQNGAREAISDTRKMAYAAMAVTACWGATLGMGQTSDTLRLRLPQRR